MRTILEASTWLLATVLVISPQVTNAYTGTTVPEPRTTTIEVALSQLEQGQHSEALDTINQKIKEINGLDGKYDSQLSTLYYTAGYIKLELAASLVKNRLVADDSYSSSALRDFEKSLSLDAQNRDALRGMAVSLNSLGEYLKLEKLIRINLNGQDPRDNWMALRLADLIAKREPEKAIDLLKNIIESQPPKGNLLGEIYKRWGELSISLIETEEDFDIAFEEIEFWGQKKDFISQERILLEQLLHTPYFKRRNRVFLKWLEISARLALLPVETRFYDSLGTSGIVPIVEDLQKIFEAPSETAPEPLWSRIENGSAALAAIYFYLGSISESNDQRVAIWTNGLFSLVHRHADIRGGWRKLDNGSLLQWLKVMNELALVSSATGRKDLVERVKGLIDSGPKKYSYETASEEIRLHGNLGFIFLSYYKKSSKIIDLRIASQHFQEAVDLEERMSRTYDKPLRPIPGIRAGLISTLENLDQKYLHHYPKLADDLLQEDFVYKADETLREAAIQIDASRGEDAWNHQQLSRLSDHVASLRMIARLRRDALNGDADSCHPSIIKGLCKGQEVSELFASVQSKRYSVDCLANKERATDQALQLENILDYLNTEDSRKVAFFSPSDLARNRWIGTQLRRQIEPMQLSTSSAVAPDSPFEPRLVLVNGNWKYFFQRKKGNDTDPSRIDTWADQIRIKAGADLLVRTLDPIRVRQHGSTSFKAMLIQEVVSGEGNVVLPRHIRFSGFADRLSSFDSGGPPNMHPNSAGAGWRLELNQLHLDRENIPLFTGSFEIQSLGVESLIPNSTPGTSTHDRKPNGDAMMPSEVTFSIPRGTVIRFQLNSDLILE